MSYFISLLSIIFYSHENVETLSGVSTWQESVQKKVFNSYLAKTSFRIEVFQLQG